MACPRQDFLKRFAAKSLVPLAWGENGLRHVSNSKRPIATPEDLKGLKLRLPQSDVIVLNFKALRRGNRRVGLAEAVRRAADRPV